MSDKFIVGFFLWLTRPIFYEKYIHCKLLKIFIIRHKSKFQYQGTPKLQRKRDKNGDI